jgi:hypothetical protein
MSNTDTKRSLLTVALVGKQKIMILLSVDALGEGSGIPDNAKQMSPGIMLLTLYPNDPLNPDLSSDEHLSLYLSFDTARTCLIPWGSIVQIAIMFDAEKPKPRAPWAPRLVK